MNNSPPSQPPSNNSKLFNLMNSLKSGRSKPFLFPSPIPPIEVTPRDEIGDEEFTVPPIGPLPDPLKEDLQLKVMIPSQNSSRCNSLNNSPKIPPKTSISLPPHSEDQSTSVQSRAIHLESGARTPRFISPRVSILDDSNTPFERTVLTMLTKNSESIDKFKKDMIQYIDNKFKKLLETNNNRD